MFVLIIYGFRLNTGFMLTVVAFHYIVLRTRKFACFFKPPPDFLTLHKEKDVFHRINQNEQITV